MSTTVNDSTSQPPVSVIEQDIVQQLFGASRNLCRRLLPNMALRGRARPANRATRMADRVGMRVYQEQRAYYAGLPRRVFDAAYSIRVSVPVAISAAAQITSRFIQARRRMPTPSFSNTSNATNAVTAK
jgi:hypothetical protein